MNQLKTTTQVRGKLPPVITFMDGLLAVMGVVAVAALVLEYGFRKTPFSLTPAHLHLVEAVIVGVFVLDRILRVTLARQRVVALRENMVDFILIAVALIAIAISYNTHAPGVFGAGALYVLITQAYLLIALLLRGISVNLRVAESHRHSATMLVVSFALLVLVGAGLLALPVAVPESQADPNRSLNPHDALFTATSAVCVTGLTVKDTGMDFSLFGQVVILALIQTGGLGIMLFGTILAMMVGKSVSARHSTALGAMLSSEQAGQVTRLVVFVIAVTLGLEAAGAIALYPMFSQACNATGTALTPMGAAWYSVFHSVSAFCNAGFSLYGRNLMAGVDDATWAGPLRNCWQVLGVMAPLIALGGIGFPVLQDVANCLGSLLRRARRRTRHAHAIMHVAPQRKRLSLHSRIALLTSALLIVLGAAGLLMVEPPPGGSTQVIGRNVIGQATGLNDWQAMGWAERIPAALFQSVSARTAGFNTIDLAQLSDAGKLWMCLLMTIGGSPSSTAGGMKTVTFALLLMTTWSQLRRRPDVEGFHRSLTTEMVFKGFTLAVLYLGLLTVVTLALTVAMRPGFRFIDLLFEACSACGTVGLSTGITTSLNVPGKYILIAGMFIGRVGPLTLLLALTTRIRQVNYSYPSESLIIG